MGGPRPNRAAAAATTTTAAATVIGCAVLLPAATNVRNGRGEGHIIAVNVNVPSGVGNHVPKSLPGSVALPTTETQQPAGVHDATLTRGSCHRV